MGGTPDAIHSSPARSSRPERAPSRTKARPCGCTRIKFQERRLARSQSLCPAPAVEAFGVFEARILSLWISGSLEKSSGVFANRAYAISPVRCDALHLYT